MNTNKNNWSEEIEQLMLTRPFESLDVLERKAVLEVMSEEEYRAFGEILYKNSLIELPELATDISFFDEALNANKKKSRKPQLWFPWAAAAAFALLFFMKDVQTQVIVKTEEVPVLVHDTIFEKEIQIVEKEVLRWRDKEVIKWLPAPSMKESSKADGKSMVASMDEIDAFENFNDFKKAKKLGTSLEENSDLMEFAVGLNLQ